MINYQIVREEDGTASVSAFLAGKLQLADAQHPNFREICTLLVATNGDVPERDLLELFDLPLMIGSIFERLSDRVHISGNRVYFDHDEMADPLTQAILRFKQEGHDFQHLVNFFEKVAINPEPYSREQLYNWLDRHDFTITPEGDIIAYKGVTREWKSTQSGRAIVDGVVVEGLIPYRIGSVVQMPRNEVTFDPNAGCSVGLHAATFGFAKGYGNRVVAVRVNPRDVVSVPAADVKMRVCELTVLEEVTGPYESALRPVSFSTTDDDGNEIGVDWKIGDDVSPIGQPHKHGVIVDLEEDDGRSTASWPIVQWDDGVVHPGTENPISEAPHDLQRYVAELDDDREDYEPSELSPEELALERDTGPEVDNLAGSEGQDRESYTDTQDRRTYEPDPELERLLAEEEEIKRATRAKSSHEFGIVDLTAESAPPSIMEQIRNMIANRRPRKD